MDARDEARGPGPPAGRAGEDPCPAERRALLGVLARAFCDNPMNVALHGPSPRRRVRANRAGLRALVLDARPPAVVRVVREGGRVVGGFVGVAPGGLPLPAPSLGRQLSALWQQGARAIEGWSRVRQELMALHPDETFWYLAVLGVEPERQGRGLGGRLLEELDRVVARDPAPIYLECDRPASVRFYERHGLRARGDRVIFGVRCVGLGRGLADEDRDLCDSVRVDPGGLPQGLAAPRSNDATRRDPA